ncbi:hypothetical protein GCM10009721_38820 [Terrabacter tumescens]|uniref:Uncharacterized protein n=1 Tax=Terrabacter tumescens TaxID=60443 RepID=A0ABQ2ICR8_9MICO|nr:hypothetical protein GCM10009721_38820 [Terrabacter tumescens]
MRSVERSPEHANPSVVDRYFRTAPSPSLDEIRDAVWNDAGPAGAPAAAAAATGALVEQYRLYVEMADRISARRGRSPRWSRAGS